MTLRQIHTYTTILHTWPLLILHWRFALLIELENIQNLCLKYPLQRCNPLNLTNLTLQIIITTDDI